MATEDGLKRAAVPRRDNRAFSAIAVGVGAAGALLLLELLFRLVPVSESFERVAGEPPFHITHYARNASFTYSIGRRFEQVVTKRTNNYGFANDGDYRRNASPDAVVIGDSFVEALQVDNSRAVGGVLSALVSPKQVYSLGLSGAALSQYLAFMRFAESEFRPRAYAFVVVANDFDESLCSVSSFPGLHCFDEQLATRYIPLVPAPPAVRLLRRSALARYIAFNAGFRRRDLLFWRNAGQMDTDRYAGNTESFKSAEIVRRSRMAIDRFLEEASALAAGRPMILVVDADRRGIYEGRIRGDTFFGEMRAYLLTRAAAHGFQVIDMQPRFESDFKLNGARFEFPSDAHWNERAHALVAREIAGRIQSGSTDWGRPNR